MALEFDPSPDQYLAQASAVPVSSYPLTISAWVSPHVVNNFGIIAGLWKPTGIGQGYFAIGHKLETGGAGNFAAFEAYSWDGLGRESTSLVKVTCTAGYATNTWQHICGVFGTQEQSIYMNGSDKGAAGAADNFTTMTSTDIGWNPRASGVGSGFNGFIAEVAMWSVELNATEVLDLSQGMKSDWVRPANLVWWKRMIRDEDVEIISGMSMSATGPPVPAGTHPPIKADRFWSLGPSVAAAPSDARPFARRLMPPGDIGIYRTGAAIRTGYRPSFEDPTGPLWPMRRPTMHADTAQLFTGRASRARAPIPAIISIEAEQITRDLWMVKWVASVAGPFYVWRNGELLGQTYGTQWRFGAEEDNEASVIDVFADPDERPATVRSSRMELAWASVDETDHYRVEQFIDDDWVLQNKTAVHGGDEYNFQSDLVADTDTHPFRVVPVGTNGVTGSPVGFTKRAVRHPSQPNHAIAFDDGDGTVTLTE